MFSEKPRKYKLLLFSLIVSFLFSAVFASAETDKALSSGETLYVPVYSNVYSGPKATPFQLAAMLSIHNVDPRYSITILKVDYHDSTGKFIESYIKKPVSLKPFAHTFFYLKEYDTRGGPGANFIVKWRAEKKANQPVVEALMYGARAGISFTSPGRIIREHAE
jgi:hypothetical protein